MAFLGKHLAGCGNQLFRRSRLGKEAHVLALITFGSVLRIAQNENRQTGNTCMKLGYKFGRTKAGKMIARDDQSQIVRKRTLFNQAQCLRSISNPLHVGETLLQHRHTH